MFLVYTLLALEIMKSGQPEWIVFTMVGMGKTWCQSNMQYTMCTRKNLVYTLLGRRGIRYSACTFNYSILPWKYCGDVFIIFSCFVEVWYCLHMVTFVQTCSIASRPLIFLFFFTTHSLNYNQEFVHYKIVEIPLHTFITFDI